MAICLLEKRLARAGACIKIKEMKIGWLGEILLASVD